MSEEIIWDPEVDLVTPERLAKGDLTIRYNGKERIDHAAIVFHTVIKSLIGGEVLQQHHEIYGLGFLELRHAFRSPWTEKGCAVLLAQWGQGLSVSHAGDIYQNVNRGMLGRGIEVIEHALNASACYANHYHNSLYQEHFDRLVELMDAERERILNLAQH